MKEKIEFIFLKQNINSISTRSLIYFEVFMFVESTESFKERNISISETAHV